jgi:hypothetical protein
MIRNLYIAIDHNYRRIWRYQGEVIRICISKNRQHKIQKGKYKRTNNDLQKHGHFYGLLIKFTTPTEGNYFLSIENGCNIISPKLCVYLIFTAKFNDSSIFITIIACDYLSLRMNMLVTSQYQPRLSSITKIFSRRIRQSDCSIQIKINYSRLVWVNGSSKHHNQNLFAPLNN